MANKFENLSQYLPEWENKDIHKHLVEAVNVFDQKEKRKSGFQTLIFYFVFDNKISTKLISHCMFILLANHILSRD